MKAAWLAAICMVAAMAQPKSGFEYNGIIHVSWQANEYTNASGAPSRAAITATGANWAGLLVTWYQPNTTSTTIAATGSTPSDTALVSAIQEFHNQGLKVMLKPHVDLSQDPNHWRGEINPQDKDAWFASYTPFIVKYAQMAEANGVEGLVIGTELVMMSGSGNHDRWNAVFDRVREVYHGLITYSANATWAADEFTSVTFWDRVDLMGLDGYFPLTNHSDPSLAELVAAWRGNKDGLNILAAVQNLHGQYQKPVIFTELGYRSYPGTHIAPYSYSANTAPADPAEQRNCYDAFYTVWNQQSAWLKGVFWWAWDVSAPPANDRGYSPRGKPAEDVLRAWQSPPDSAFAVVGAASYKPEAVAPGGIVALFGNSMAGGTGLNSGFPLPMNLADASVTINGIPVPLFFVSPGQINAQVPFDAVPGNGMAEVTSSTGSTWIPLTIAAAGPGIFTSNQQGTGEGAILDAQNFRKITADDPATPSEWIQIYCTGLGAVVGAITAGDATPDPPPLLPITAAKPEVRIDGQTLAADWAGLAPGWVGLYAVNVQLPSNIAPGIHQLQLVMGAAVSNTVTFSTR